MRSQTIVPSLALALTAALGSPQLAVAQNANRPLPADTVAGVPVRGLAAILLAESVLESERAGDAVAAGRVNRAADIASRGYQAAASDPAITRELLARAIVNHYARRTAPGAPEPRASSADEQLLRLALLQTAQNARIVEQNERVIQLLEALAAKNR